MSSGQPGLPSPAPGVHPAVLSRRMQDVLMTAAAALISLALALAITLTVHKPNYPLVISVIVGLVVIAALIANRRIELSVAFLAVYLGCINGPVKLIGAGGVVTSAVQDVLIGTVFLSLLYHRSREGKPLRLPPMSAWLIAFFFVVLIEAFNPRTHGLLKIGAGMRQQLQWTPFFIFGYLVVRSKGRLRTMAILLGVVAALNGIVSTYQTQLSPKQVAAWGPGYAAKVEGKAGRTYKSEGVAHVRPTGLGQESGTGAGFGLIALAGTFALIITAKRRRWLAMILAFGALAAVATGLGRLQVVGGVIAIAAFVLLTLSAGRRVGRTLMTFAIVMSIVVVVGTIFVSAVGEGVFSRYASISPSKVTSTGTSYKANELESIPAHMEVAPFGFGLGTAGAASGFGGKVEESFEGHDVNAETQFNFISNELGIPGLILWIALIGNVIVMVIVRLRRVQDGELQIYLAGVFAPLIAYSAMAFNGPLSASQSAGPYFWFAVGVAAYWFHGAGWRIATKREPAPPRTPDFVPAGIVRV